MTTQTQQEYEAINQLQLLPVHEQAEILNEVIVFGFDLVSAVAARLSAHGAAEIGRGGN